MGKRKLPEGWRLASLGDDSLVTIIMGQSPPGETFKDRLEFLFFKDVLILATCLQINQRSCVLQSDKELLN
jgi:hypothetical protein